MTDHEDDLHAIRVASNTGMFQRMQARIISHPRVAMSIKEAERAGVPWGQILLTLLPFVIAAMLGKPVDIEALIAAIMALIGRTR